MTRRTFVARGLGLLGLAAVPVVAVLVPTVPPPVVRRDVDAAAIADQIVAMQQTLEALRVGMEDRQRAIAQLCVHVDAVVESRRCPPPMPA